MHRAVFHEFTSWGPVIVQYCGYDSLGVQGAHGVGRHLSRQLAPIPAGDVRDDGTVSGQLLGAEQFHYFVGGAVVDAVLDVLSILQRNRDN